MTANPTDPTEKNKRGISSRWIVIHLVIQPNRRTRKHRKVPTLRRVLALYLVELLGSLVMMRSSCRPVDGCHQPRTSE